MRLLESGRLLYVATTRARRELHLFGHASESSKGEIKPAAASLLARLWPALQDHWLALAESGQDAEGQQASAAAAQPPLSRGPFLQRIPSQWVCPEPPPDAAPVAADETGIEEEIPFEWAGAAARAVGTVVHRLLQHQVESRLERPAYPRPVIDALLLGQGVRKRDLAWTAKRVRQALDGVMSDDRGRWLLSPEHEDSRCEVPLTAVINGRIRHMVVDRTFVDAHGTRWIIDYKTSTHAGGDLSGFLEQEEERYRAQLCRYSAIYAQLTGTTARAALYFPLLQAFREVDVTR